MADNIIQCCYSNLLSESGTAGWRVAATSPNVSTDTMEKYAKIQDVNVCNSEPLDKDGNPLNLFELVIDQNYAYLTRITYGLIVPGGRRNNMLSHSYLFPLDEGALVDPNTFLTVADSNFTGDIEVASNIRDHFERAESYSMESAMQACGMDKERLLQLIYCIHMQKEQKRTLYIHTEQGETFIRPFLYLVLTSIPFSMRRNFSCASEAVSDNTSKTVIFSDRHMSDDLYFDLDTGKNNVLDTRAEKKYRRWGYVDYYVEHYSDVDGTEFFQELENVANRLGDEKASKSKILRIAFQIMMSENDEDDFDTNRVKLYEALLAPVKGGDYIDDYMAGLLQKINDTGKQLDDEVEKKLIEKLNTQVSEKLENTGEQYMINRILHLPVREGAAILAGLSTERFDRYVSELVQAENGEEYIDFYFAEYYKVEPLNWAGMEQYLNRINHSSVEQLPLTTEKWLDNCWQIYQENFGKTSAVSNLSAFEETISYFATPEQSKALQDKAKAWYWGNFSFSDFSYDRENEYQVFDIQDEFHADSCNLLCRMIESLRKLDVNAFDRCRGRWFTSCGRMLSREERIRVDKIIDGELRQAEQIGLGKCASLHYQCHVEFLMNDSYSPVLEDMESYLNGGDIDQYKRIYEDEIRRFRMDADSKKLIDSFNRCICYRLHENDGIDSHCLDVLLLMGHSMYDNPFKILDRTDFYSRIFSKVIYEDPMVLVESNELLTSEYYLGYAKEFYSEDVEISDCVRSWISASKKAKRSKRRDNMDDSNPLKRIGGLFGKK